MQIKEKNKKNIYLRSIGKMKKKKKYSKKKIKFFYLKRLKKTVRK